MNGPEPSQESTPLNVPSGPALRDDLRWFCVILGLCVAGSFPLVLGGVRSFFFRDYGVIALPFVQFHHDQFWAGNPFPLWNPLSNCGAPFLAQWGTMVLYPFSLIYLLLPLPWSLGVFCLAHLFLGGVGMFLLAHRWTHDRAAASVAGVGFAFSGFVLSALVWPNYQVALGWMPFVVLSAERAGREGGRWILGAALVAAMQLLAGVPEVTLLTWIAVIAMESMAGGGCLRRGVRLGVVVTLAAALCAAQLLPFLDLLAHSQREPGLVTTKWAMPPWGAAHFLVPLFHAFITPQWTWFQEGQEFVSSYYVGMGILLPALAAIVIAPGRRTWCLAGLGVLGTLLAMGEHGFVLPAVKSLLPGVGLARYPIKAVALVTFVLPLLAALALAQMRSKVPGSRGQARRVLVAIAVLLAMAIAAILWWAKNHPFPYDQWESTWKNAAGRVLCIGISVGCALWLADGREANRERCVLIAMLVALVIDGWTHWPNLAPTQGAENLTSGLAREALALSPAPETGRSRVMIVPAAEQKLLRSGVSDWRADFLGKRRALWSNLNALDGIPKVNGSSTLQVREQAAVQKLLYASPETDLPGLLDFLAVSHITKPGSVVEWSPRTTAQDWVSAGREPLFADAEATLKGLASSDFDPRRTVFVDEQHRPELKAEADRGARVETRLRSTEHFVVEVQAERPVLLTLAQSHYSPWRARVDGAPATLIRVNHAFQGVAVPAGRHEVRLDYEDRRFRVGACISLAAVALVAGLWFRMRSKSS